MNTRSQTLRNTAFSSVGIYTEFALGMLTSILIARHLGPHGFGAYSLVIWLVAIGVATTNSGTASAAIKFVAEVRGAGRDDLIRPLVAYLRRAQRLFLLIVLVAGAALFVFAGDKLAPGFDHRMLLGFLVLGTALRASYMFNIGIAKGFENFRATAIIALISTPFNLAFVTAAVLWGAAVEWLLGVFVVSGVVFYLVSQWQVKRMLPAPTTAGTALEPGLLQRVHRHMWVSAMTVSIGFFAASEVEVLILTLYAGPDAAGHFKVAYQLALGATMLVPGVFGALLLPMMANALSQGQAVAGRRFAASTRYLMLLSAPLVGFGLVFSTPLIHALYGGAYDDSAVVFAGCLVAAALSTVSQAGSSLLVSADRQHSMLVLLAACVVLKVTLGVFLVQHYGLNGAVMAYMIVAATAASIVMTLAIRVSGIALDWIALLRVLLAAALAAALTIPLRGLPHPLLAIVIGGPVLLLSYLGLTLLLGCWSRDDIEHLQRLHQRFTSGRPRFSARILHWAHARARSEAR